MADGKWIENINERVDSNVNVRSARFTKKFCFVYVRTLTGYFTLKLSKAQGKRLLSGMI
jgi:hypothetical protein